MKAFKCPLCGLALSTIATPPSPSSLLLSPPPKPSEVYIGNQSSSAATLQPGVSSRPRLSVGSIVLTLVALSAVGAIAAFLVPSPSDTGVASNATVESPQQAESNATPPQNNNEQMSLPPALPPQATYPVPTPSPQKQPIDQDYQRLVSEYLTWLQQINRERNRLVTEANRLLEMAPDAAANHYKVVKTQYGWFLQGFDQAAAPDSCQAVHTAFRDYLYRDWNYIENLSRRADIGEHGPIPGLPSRQNAELNRNAANNSEKRADIAEQELRLSRDRLMSEMVKLRRAFPDLPDSLFDLEHLFTIGHSDSP